MNTQTTCSACGAPLELVSELHIIECSYCGNKTNLPSSIHLTELKYNGSKENKTAFINIVTLIQNAEKSQNYIEALKYCEEALVLDPKNSKVWEHKAICYYWVNSNSINKSVVTEVTRCLQNARGIDIEETCKMLSNNIYTNLAHNYNKMEFDQSLSGEIWDSFSDKSITKIIHSIEAMDLCFKMHPENKFLILPINELSGLSKIQWISKNENDFINNPNYSRFEYDAISERNRLIEKIKKINSGYAPPAIHTIDPLKIPNKNNCFIATACYGSYMDSAVIDLRLFRDQVLIKNSIGMHIIMLYYTYSPKISKYIQNKYLIKFLIKYFLIEPIVFIIKFFKLIKV